MSRLNIGSAAAGLLSVTLALTGFAEVGTARATGILEVQQDPSMEYPDLPSSGKKCRIDNESYFTYEFTEKPRLGTAILRVRIFGRDGNRSTEFTVLGRSNMPSMPGAHDSGDQEFKLSKRGDYLLPVNIVMPGEWEIKLSFKRAETIVLRGAFRFDV